LLAFLTHGLNGGCAFVEFRLARGDGSGVVEQRQLIEWPFLATLAESDQQHIELIAEFLQRFVQGLDRLWHRRGLRVAGEKFQGFEFIEVRCLIGGRDAVPQLGVGGRLLRIQIRVKPACEHAVDPAQRAVFCRIDQVFVHAPVLSELIDLRHDPRLPFGELGLKECVDLLIVHLLTRVDGGLHQFDFALQTGGVDLCQVKALESGAECRCIAADDHAHGICERVQVGKDGGNLGSERIAFFQQFNPFGWRGRGGF
jgi:hypothetical protein